MQIRAFATGDEGPGCETACTTDFSKTLSLLAQQDLMPGSPQNWSRRIQWGRTVAPHLTFGCTSWLSPSSPPGIISRKLDGTSNHYSNKYLTRSWLCNQVTMNSNRAAWLGSCLLGATDTGQICHFWLINQFTYWKTKSPKNAISPDGNTAQLICLHAIVHFNVISLRMRSDIGEYKNDEGRLACQKLISAKNWFKYAYALFFWFCWKLDGRCLHVSGWHLSTCVRMTPVYMCQDDTCWKVSTCVRMTPAARCLHVSGWHLSTCVRMTPAGRCLHVSGWHLLEGVYMCQDDTCEIKPSAHNRYPVRDQCIRVCEKLKYHLLLTHELTWGHDFWVTLTVSGTRRHNVAIIGTTWTASTEKIWGSSFDERCGVNL